MAYDAVGRIGAAHGDAAGAVKTEGGTQNTLGSAVLITPRHVLTNYHVWKNGLSSLNPQSLRKFGIEFMALSGSTNSEFTAFDDRPPIILPQMDAVVLSLSAPSTRTPIWPVDQRKENEAVILIGYPAAPRRPVIGFKKIQIEEIYGAAPKWDVKRWSDGRTVCLPAEASSGDAASRAGARDMASDHFFHFADMHQHGEAAKRPVLCHSASSMDGNSGGALISVQTGAFIGLHCGGAYVHGRDINFAIAGRDLLRALSSRFPAQKNTLPKGGHS